MTSPSLAKAHIFLTRLTYLRHRKRERYFDNRASKARG